MSKTDNKIKEEIRCDLMDVSEFPSVKSQDNKLRKGRYHGSVFTDVKEFGKKKWVVAAKIKLHEGYSEEFSATEMARACVKYLNKPPERERFQKRLLSPKYGTLELHSAKLVNNEKGKHLSVLLIVGENKNPHFWGKGRIT